MPAPGDQHKQSWSNPFEEVKPRVSEWTAKEIATISSRLDKQLGPEYISSRAGPGGSRVHYLTAEKCIGLANEVFGFNGWSSSIQNIQVDFADENPQTQRVSIGLSVILRVTLRDGTYHEDIGYGSIENAKGKAMAFEKAKKEGTTDALKRTLRNFGNVLGNCVYDKDYLNQVTKLKAQPVKRFDQDNLHRHHDFVAKKELVKTESVIVAASNTGNNTKLDEADFCVPGEGHPDEIVLPNSISTSNDKPASNLGKQMQQSAGPASRPIPASNANRQPHTPKPPQYRPGMQGDGQGASRPAPQGMAPPQGASAGNPSEPVAAFFSAKAALGESNQHSQQKPLFNPKAESPSIRKTPGIDHTTSKPLARSGQHVAPSSSQSTAAPAAAPTGNSGSFTPLRHGISSSQSGRGSMANPSLDQARRIGAPGGMGSPLANRNQYRPPTMKRTLPNEGNGARAPLVDIPANGNANAGAGDGVDAKRQKVA
ncbi:DNA repair and recombination protein mus-11 [Cladobotryum mycophilum]|uniref:DNA repair and recombination protein mus-11 n=1 Tax=Cladobotryum mycophilum TaxID=491253 RepID=A0ABR0S528_9HYPO